MKFYFSKRKQKNNKKRRSIIIAAILLSVVFAFAAVIIHLDNRRVSSENIYTEIERYAAKHGIPPELVLAVIEKESRMDPKMRGRAGEIGLMQLMPPGTPGAPEEWARIHKTRCPSERQLFKIDCNINIGCWYLARAIRKWKDYRCCYELALIEYNAGGKNANLCKPPAPDGDVIPRIKIPSTKRYVIDIMTRYRQLSLEKNSTR